MLKKPTAENVCGGLAHDEPEEPVYLSDSFDSFHHLHLDIVFIITQLDEFCVAFLFW